MSYLVLARKWRPQTFDDLVGQEHVSRTLANAIQSGRVAHAFLFTGVRGVGKTTSARIMAKALNCQKQDGPTATPCLSCPACREIASGADVDVQEIDGASYNGVDEVRKLQESLPYRPARDRYKIVIVDEVHMLSSSAWNAFLKTLEEPPPHVKFIFATTEVHKVPITILSRCQRYDFKLIPAQLIAKRLRFVLDAEHIVADDAAVSLVAREAAGSMRDAMSLLDQAIAWGGDKLVGDDVAKVLGVAGRAVLLQIARALVCGDPRACLAVVAQLADQGYDMAHLTRDFLAMLRDLVVLRVVEKPGELLDLADEEQRDADTVARTTDADDLLRLHFGFSRAHDDIVRSAQPRAALEMALVRLSRRPPLLPVDDLIARLAELEKRLGAGPGGRPPQAGPARGPGPSAGSPSAGAPSARTASPAPRASALDTAAPPGVAPAAPAPAAPFAAPAPAAPFAAPAPAAPFAAPAPAAPFAAPAPAAPFAAPAPAASAPFTAPAPAASPVPAPAAPFTAPAPVASAPFTAPAPAAPFAAPAPVASAPFTAPAPLPAAPFTAPAPAATAAPTPAAPFAAPVPASSAPFTAPAPAASPAPATASRSAPPPMQAAPAASTSAAAARPPAPARPRKTDADLVAWRAILERIRTERPMLASVLENAAPLSVGPERVVLGYEPNSFYCAQAMDPSAVNLLTQTIQAHFGTSTSISFDLEADLTGIATIAAINGEEHRARVEAARQAVMDHPLVRAVIEYTGAELREIRLPESA